MTRRIAGARTFAKALVGSLALATLLANTAQAATYIPAQSDMYRPEPKEGGIDSVPKITAVTPSGTNVVVNFDGLQAPYHVEMSPDNTIWDTNAAAANIKWPRHSASATVSNVALGTNAFFRLNMHGQSYVGAMQCNGCHGDKVTGWLETAHATAIDCLKDSNGVVSAFFSASCTPCHSVGKNQPGGFTDITNTPHLASVGCEACHGPGGAHINLGGTRTYRPVQTLAPELCGGCHTDSHHPTFEEWEESHHRRVSLDVSYGVASGTGYPDTINVGGTNWYGYVVTTNGVTNTAAGIINSVNAVSGFGRQMSCGPCHSAATRMAMLANYQDRLNGYTNNLLLPSPIDGAEWGATCVTCHDPHQNTNPAQLRNPMRSTNYFSFFTGSVTGTNFGTNVFGQRETNIWYKNDVFAAQYDPSIQICAQCHNSRGARWDGRSKTYNAASNAMVLGSSQSFSRPPHHSPQYNILIGIAQDDYLNVNAQGVATNYSARHGLTASSSTGVYNTNQCATCHVPIYSVSSTTNVTGHTYELDVNGCALGGCHLSGVPNIEEFQHTQTNAITRIVSLLNQWAAAKGPAIFTTNYSRYSLNAWEFQNIGALATVTNAGPTGTDATRVPDAIKQARFNTYMVLHDGSLGVHNPRYVPFLLSDAENKVLSQFPLANFKANATAGFPGATIYFTNMGVGVTGYDWAFGDGNTSTAANPANTYAAVGTYSVRHTATGASGSETVVRTNYITIYDRPVPSFTSDVTTGTAPLTVNFTNTSTHAESYTWTFLSGVTSRSTNPSFTYTNAGTYNVILRGTNPGGSVSVTNVAYITVTP